MSAVLLSKREDYKNVTRSGNIQAYVQLELFDFRGHFTLHGVSNFTELILYESCSFV